MLQCTSWFCHSSYLHLIAVRRCYLFTGFKYWPVDYGHKSCNWGLDLRLNWRLICCWSVLFESRDLSFKLLRYIGLRLKHCLCLLKLLLKSSILLAILLFKLLNILLMSSLQLLNLLFRFLLFIQLDCIHLRLNIIFLLRLDLLLLTLNLLKLLFEIFDQFFLLFERLFQLIDQVFLFFCLFC